MKRQTTQTEIVCDNCEETTTEEKAEKLYGYKERHLCEDCQDRYPDWFKYTANISRLNHFPSPEEIENNVWLVIEGEDSHFSKHDTVESAKKQYEKIEESLRYEEHFKGIFDGKEMTGHRPQKSINWVEKDV